MKFLFLIKNYNKIFLSYFFIFILFFFELFFSKYEYKQTFFITPNESLNTISNNLYKENIIDNKFFFKLFVYLSLSEKKIKAGEYQFYKNNIFQQIAKIRNGDVYFRKITIPEGLNTKEIINILKNTEGIILEKNFNLEEIEEGSLFPSTYFYTYGTNFNIIINRMRKEMILVLEDAWVNRDKNLFLKNINEALILASLIEKETSLNAEKTTIAGVFLNRLKLNMKLQSDPTVIYGIENDLNIKKIKLSKKDLDYDSNFNTYVYKGLPEGPICNPGKEAILAATKPDNNNYLYFVANGQGGHNFSDNLEKHIENVKKYRNLENNK